MGKMSRCNAQDTTGRLLTALILFLCVAFRNSEDSLAYGSLALGPTSMPSISDLDHSLTLPQFPSSTSRRVGQDVGALPSIGELDQSISLPQFPRTSRRDELEQSLSLPQFPQSSRGQPPMSSINEVSHADTVVKPLIKDPMRKGQPPNKGHSSGYLLY